MKTGPGARALFSSFPWPPRTTFSLSGGLSRLRNRRPSVYRTDSSLIRSPAGVERTAGPPPRVWASVPRLPGVPPTRGEELSPGLTLSVAMLPCLSFWPRPLECKVVPWIAGGTVAPAHSGETHSRFPAFTTPSHYPGIVCVAQTPHHQNSPIFRSRD